MGNLGWYQLITTIAKKVGGMKKLVFLGTGGSAAIGAGLFAGIQVLSKRIKLRKNKKDFEQERAVIYRVNTAGKSNEGVQFTPDDRFRVLAHDGDIGLIDRIDDDNSPYFVSLQFLSTISDYKSE